MSDVHTHISITKHISELIESSRNNPALDDINKQLDILEINLESLSQTHLCTLLEQMFTISKIKDEQISNLNKLLFLKEKRITELEQ